MNAKRDSKKGDVFNVLPWYTKAFCICVIFISLSISLDLLFPQDKKGVIDDLSVLQFERQNKQGRTYTSGYLTEVKSGDLVFSIPSKRNTLFVSDTIYVKYTPYYKFIMNFYLFRSGKLFDKSPPEGTFIFFPF